MSRKSLLHLFASHQTGQCTNLTLRSEIMKVKLRQLSFTNSISHGRPQNCHLVVNHKDTFLGAWGDNLAWGCRSMLEALQDEDPPRPAVFVKDIFFPDNTDPQNSSNDEIQEADVCNSTVLYNSKVLDICGVDVDEGLEFVLFVAKSLELGHNFIQIIPRRYTRSGSPDILYGLDALSRRFEIYSPVHCCTWNEYTKTFAVGTGNGIFTRSLKEWRIPVENNNHTPELVEMFEGCPYSICFNSVGDSLFYGFCDGTLVISDLRCNAASIRSKYFVGKGINRMKLLSDDVSLIVSGQENNLSFVDTRMNAVIFSYPCHKNTASKIPFHFDESINLLCSSGQDNFTRFWSLKQGQLLCSLEPVGNPEAQLHSSFYVKNRNIHTYIFCENNIFCFKSFKF